MMTQKISDMTDPLASECAACGAERGEECRPMCIALDIDEEEEL